MDFKQLRTFLTLSRIKNFTKTAKALNYAQSNVTTQIKQLEEELGVKLFERMGKSIALTADGEQLIPYATKILSLADDVETAFGTEQAKKKLVIGASETISIYLLPSILKKYKELYPDVDLFLNIIMCEDPIKLLSDNNIDIALVINPSYSDSNIIKILEKKLTLSLFSLPDHPLSKKETVTIEDLAIEPLIVTGRDCWYRKFLEQDFINNGYLPKIILETSSIPVIKKTALSGLGICFLPDLVAKKEVEQNELVPLSITTDYPIYIQCFYHKDKWISPALKGLIELIESTTTEISY